MSSALLEDPEPQHDPSGADAAEKRKFEDSGVAAADPSSVDTTASRWYPTSIIIEARTFDGTSINADLMTVIGRGVKANKCTLSERYYLPSQYDQNNAEYRAKTIAPIFASACACAGCEVRLKGWEKSKGFLKFVCPQYRRYKSTAKQQQQQQVDPDSVPSPTLEAVNSSTNLLDDMVQDDVPASAFASNGNKKAKISSRTISRPLDKEGTCPFSFLVFWEEYSGQEGISVEQRKGRWFVCATGAGTPYHEGHSRKEFSEGELRRKQLQVEGAYEILMPYYKKVVELVDRDEEKLNQAIGRLNVLIDGLRRQQQQQQVNNDMNMNGHNLRHHEHMPSAGHLLPPHKMEVPLVGDSVDSRVSYPVTTVNVHASAPADFLAPGAVGVPTPSTVTVHHYHPESMMEIHHTANPVADHHYRITAPADPGVHKSEQDEHQEQQLDHMANDDHEHHHDRPNIMAATAEATAAALLDQSVMNEVATL